MHYDAYNQKETVTSVGENVEKLEPLHIAVELYNGVTMREKSLAIS